MFSQEAEIQVVIIGSIALGLFAVFFIILVALYNNRQRMYNQEKKLLQQDYENRIMQTKLEIAEDTAQKISRSLHDNIGQKLSAAKLLAGNTDIKDILGEVINDVRDLSSTLKSEPKINKGLNPGLTYLAELLEKQEIETTCNLGDEPDLDLVEKLTIYRVCQEAVQNILKHANAKKVTITSKSGDTFELTITDDGVGYADSADKKGSGLTNMQQRCAGINAKLAIDTSKGKGCTITINK